MMWVSNRSGKHLGGAIQINQIIGAFQKAEASGNGKRLTFQVSVKHFKWR
jgi:hypothetical protein